MIKSALDTTGKRTMSYKSSAIENINLETEFEFKGQLIVISNKKLTDFNQAMISRSLAVDVTMTRQEMIDRIEAIVNKGTVPDGAEFSYESYVAAFKILKAFAEKYIEAGKPNDLNFRTLSKISVIYDRMTQEGKSDAEIQEIIEYSLSVS